MEEFNVTQFWRQLLTRKTAMVRYSLQPNFGELLQQGDFAVVRAFIGQRVKQLDAFTLDAFNGVFEQAYNPSVSTSLPRRGPCLDT